MAQLDSKVPMPGALVPASIPPRQRTRVTGAASAALWVVLAGAAFWGAAVSHAQEEDSASQTTEDAVAVAERDAEARRLFLEGREAYERGEYRAAWDYFHRAYSMSARPALLYNVGQSADRLGLSREALKAFRLYVKKLPDADNRREVENRIRALEDRVRREEGENALRETITDGDATPGAAASAEEEVPQVPDEQPARHGWYLQGALGVGLLVDGISGEALDASVSGLGGALHVGIGYTLLPGLAVGAGLFFGWASEPSAEVENMQGTADSISMTLFGPMADWYLDPLRDGLHFQLALTFGSVHPRGGMLITPDPATGVALVVGGGYEWRISESWALGALARVVLGSMGRNDLTHQVFSPSVLANVTWY